MKHLSFLTVVGAAIVMASTQAHAQTNTRFFPGNTGGTTGGIGGQNSDGSYVHPAGLAQDGNPNQFTVGGNIADYIEITAIDDSLELGNLGGPQNIGWVASVNPASDSSILFGEVPAAKGSPAFVTQSTGNGIAGVELDSNAFIKVQADYGDDITNFGPNNTSFTVPTRYRIAARGREFRFGTSASVTNSPGTYTAFSQGSASSLTSSAVTFSPGAASGLRIMAEARRNGLNNYRGQYTTTIGLSYFKF